MRRYHIVFGILLILPIIDFAVAAPVLVQEKRQTRVNVEHMPEDAMTILGKRGGELDELNKVLSLYEDHFATPAESSATHPSSSSQPSGPVHGPMDVGQPPPSVPEGWSPEPLSPEPLTESEYELMEGDVPTRPSSAASSTTSDPELVGAHSLSDSGLSTEPGSEQTGVHAPLSGLVFPMWFHPDHGDYELMKAHASNPRPPAGPDSGHRLVGEKPPSTPASLTELDLDHEYQVVEPPTESDHEMVDVPPSSSVSPTNPKRRSMGTGSQLKNVQILAIH